jgi:hypothetical protein
MYKKIFLFIILITSIASFSQSQTTQQQITNFLDDAVLYADKFVNPATDAAIYISNSNWMTTAKKRKLYTVSFSLHANYFVVPKSDRTFSINNNDFKFFTIKDAAGQTVNETIEVPSVFGGDSSYNLTGQISISPVSIRIPKGVSREAVPYPFAQIAISLWKGFELMGKYSPRISYNQIQYKISGIGVKHNFSQYFEKFNTQKINISGIVSYAKEDITTSFITVTTDFGTLGIDQMTSYIKTWNFQFGVSKEWKNFELIFNTITSNNSFEYVVTGPKGTIEDLFVDLNIQSLFNEKLKTIYKTRLNSMLEVSGRYQYKKFALQSGISFGKFLNTNASLQYEF